MPDEWGYLLGLRYAWLEGGERVHAKDGIRAGLLRVDGRGFISRGSHFVTFKIV